MLPVVGEGLVGVLGALFSAGTKVVKLQVEEVAEVAFRQQARWNPDISMKECVDSVEKILSLRDVFHLIS